MSSSHIHNPPLMHRHSALYAPAPPYMRTPYQLHYSPPYYAFPPGFDPSISLAHPYIYDPTHIKHRRRTTPEQLKILEDTFKTDPKPNPTLRKQLSIQLGMSPRVLQVWFQNRRMKVKRLAKKQSAAEQRPASPTDGEQTDAPAEHSGSPVESPSNSPASLPSAAPTPAESSSSPEAASEQSSPAAARSGSLPDLSNRRVSLPVLTSSFPSPAADNTPSSSSVFEAVTDPAPRPGRRLSLTSMQRLESHPFAPLVAARNGVQSQQIFSSIVPPSLPTTFRPPRLIGCGPGPAAFHHHSASTHVPQRPMASVMPQTSRAASFHVLPAEHRLHQPYAFPPRSLPPPGPGPLPAADYSFGTSTPHGPADETTQEEFDVRPYIPSASAASYSVQAAAAAAAGFAFAVPRLVRQDDDTDASTSYTGYSSRFGSIASVAESDASGRSVCGRAPSVSSAPGSVGAWDASERWVEEEGRRGSWTGQVVELFSGLDVRGDASGKTAEMRYGNPNLWDPAHGLDRYTSSSSQESLGIYAHVPNTAKDERVYRNSVESTVSYHTGAEDSYRNSAEDSTEGGIEYSNNVEDATPPAAGVPPPQQYGVPQPQYSISQSSELAFALYAISHEGTKQHQQHQQQLGQQQLQHGQQGQHQQHQQHQHSQQQSYPLSTQTQAHVQAHSQSQSQSQSQCQPQTSCADHELFDIHQALTGFAEQSGVEGLAASYAIGTFPVPDQEKCAGEGGLYNMF